MADASAAARRPTELICVPSHGPVPRGLRQGEGNLVSFLRSSGHTWQLNHLPALLSVLFQFRSQKSQTASRRSPRVPGPVRTPSCHVPLGHKR